MLTIDCEPILSFNFLGLICRFLFLNGGRMKTEPWKVFQELETKIGLTPFFTEDHFGRREDGFYCVKPG